MRLYTHAIKSLTRSALPISILIERARAVAGRAEVNHQNVPSAIGAVSANLERQIDYPPAVSTGETAEAAITSGHADAIAFGRIFISNPDLPRRLQHGFPLTPYTGRRSMAARRSVIPITPFMTSCSGPENPTSIASAAKAIHEATKKDGLLRRFRFSQ